jgi:hypothetical protein
MPKQRVVALSVLGLGIIGFLVDHFMLGGGLASPASANAAAPLETGEAAPASAVQKRPADGSVPPSSLIARVDAIAAKHGGNANGKHLSIDAFHAPLGWFKIDEKAVAAAKATNGKDAEAAKYRLTMVIPDQSALINGISLQVGQQKDKGKLKGVRLVSVDRDGAVIEVEGNRHRLERHEAKEGAKNGAQEKPDIDIVHHGEARSSDVPANSDGEKTPE